MIFGEREREEGQEKKIHCHQTKLSVVTCATST